MTQLIHKSDAALVVGLALAALVGCTPSTNPQTGSVNAKAWEKPTPGVVLLRYAERSGSTEQREVGFLQTLEREFPDVHILSAGVYAGTTPESTKQVMLDLMENFGDAILGVFAVCEANTDGVLRALEESGKAGKIRMVGMDPSSTSVAALKEGKLDGLVVQDPVHMGYVAVQTMVAQLRGQKVDDRISTGEYLITPDNVSARDLQPMIRPKRFSGEFFQPEKTKFTIGVVPKGSTHGFWESVHAGAEQAAAEAGDVAIRFEAPLLEGSLDRQIEIIDQMISTGVHGLCIVPIDGDALVPVVKRAKEAGIPTVIFDSNLYDDKLVRIAYIATDNYEAGAIAARQLAKVLGFSPKNGAAKTAEPKKVEQP